MKVGEVVAVTIAGQVVAQAEIRELDDETVTLIVPATKVVMAVKREIAPEVEAPREEPAVETIVTGVDRVDSNGEVISSTSTVEEKETVVVTQQEQPELPSTAEAGTGTESTDSGNE